MHHGGAREAGSETTIVGFVTGVVGAADRGGMMMVMLSLLLLPLLVLKVGMLGVLLTLL